MYENRIEIAFFTTARRKAEREREKKIRINSFYCRLFLLSFDFERRQCDGLSLSFRLFCLCQMILQTKLCCSYSFQIPFDWIFRFDACLLFHREEQTSVKRSYYGRKVEQFFVDWNFNHSFRHWLSNSCQKWIPFRFVFFSYIFSLYFCRFNSFVLCHTK